MLIIFNYQIYINTLIDIKLSKLNLILFKFKQYNNINLKSIHTHNILYNDFENTYNHDYNKLSIDNNKKKLIYNSLRYF